MKPLTVKFEWKCWRRRWSEVTGPTWYCHTTSTHYAQREAHIFTSVVDGARVYRAYVLARMENFSNLDEAKAFVETQLTDRILKEKAKGILK